MSDLNKSEAILTVTICLCSFHRTKRISIPTMEICRKTISKEAGGTSPTRKRIPYIVDVADGRTSKTEFDQSCRLLPVDILTWKLPHRRQQYIEELPVTSDSLTSITSTSNSVEFPRHVKTRLSSTQRSRVKLPRCIITAHTHRISRQYQRQQEKLTHPQNYVHSWCRIF